MTKQEFLDRLRRSLHGKITPGQIVENLQFYEDYINTEIRKGASEQEVLTRLGDPRLLARTIVETQGGQQAERAGSWYEEPEGATGTWHDSQGETAGTWHDSQGETAGTWNDSQGETAGAWHENREEYQPYRQPGERRLRLLTTIPVWAWLLLVILIIVLAVSAVFSLLAAILPILLPVLIIVFAVKAFRDWLH